jgi:hypothetical protein
MQIAISRQASEAVSLTSTRCALDELDRSLSIVESVDIYVSRPNRNFVPSLMYHNNAMTINKYVEAEQRTIPARCVTGRFLFVVDGMLPWKADGRAKTFHTRRRRGDRRQLAPRDQRSTQRERPR